MPTLFILGIVLLASFEEYAAASFSVYHPYISEYDTVDSIEILAIHEEVAEDQMTDMNNESIDLFGAF